MGEPKVGPSNGFSSLKLFNSDVKQANGEAEPVRREDGRQLTRRGKLDLSRQLGSDPSLARVPSGKTGKDSMMSRILVVDAERRPLMPTTPARARMLLKSHKAAILRRFPLVLILKDPRPEAVIEPLHGVVVARGTRDTGLPGLPIGGAPKDGWPRRAYHWYCIT